MVERDLFEPFGVIVFVFLRRLLTDCFLRFAETFVYVEASDPVVVYLNTTVSQSSPAQFQHTSLWIAMRPTLFVLLVASLATVSLGAVVERGHDGPVIAKRCSDPHKKGSGVRCSGPDQCCSGHCLKQQQSSPWPTCAVSYC